MYVLDTNVVSELRKLRLGKADANVAAWAQGVDAADLFVSAITILELELGVLSVERKDAAQGAMLRAWLEQRVLPEFCARILPVDTAVVRRCARLHVPDRRSERDALKLPVTWPASSSRAASIRARSSRLTSSRQNSCPGCARSPAGSGATAVNGGQEARLFGGEAALSW